MANSCQKLLRKWVGVQWLVVLQVICHMVHTVRLIKSHALETDTWGLPPWEGVWVRAGSLIRSGRNENARGRKSTRSVLDVKSQLKWPISTWKAKPLRSPWKYCKCYRIFHTFWEAWTAFLQEPNTAWKGRGSLGDIFQNLRCTNTLT